jgi:hypothetical protein
MDLPPVRPLPSTITRRRVVDKVKQTVKGERVRFTERTQPSGTFKAHFFQDLFQNGPPSIPRVMRVFYDGDTFVALPGGFKWLDYLVCVLSTL